MSAAWARGSGVGVKAESGEYREFLGQVAADASIDGEVRKAAEEAIR